MALGQYLGPANNFEKLWLKSCTNLMHAFYLTV